MEEDRDISEYTDKYIQHPWMSAPVKEQIPVEEPEDDPAPDVKVMTYEEALHIVEQAKRRGPKWPDKTEYIDKYIEHEREMLPIVDLPTDRPIDMLTGRPRTPNDPYTVLTDTQLRNMKKDSSPFFMLELPTDGDRGIDDPIVRPDPIDRFATNTSQYLFRDTPPKSHPHCWIGDQWMRDPPADHNTSRLGASLRWGPSKTGSRTISHFHKEDVHRYLNIDMYKRPPTNLPSMVVMKHGRPSEGYYQQRNPNFNTWFGSTHRLNETNVLTTIRPKTTAEYEQLKVAEQEYGKHCESKWPEITEYTEKFLLNKKPEKIISGMEERKQYHRELRRQEAMNMLKAQSEVACKETAQPEPVAA